MTFYKGKREPGGTEVRVTVRDSSTGERLRSLNGIPFDWGTFGNSDGRRELAWAILVHALGSIEKAREHVDLFARVYVDTLAHVRWELSRVKVQRFARGVQGRQRA